MKKILSLFSFFKSVIQEWKLIDKISMEQTYRLTLVVLGGMFLLGGMIFILDLSFLKIRNIIF